MRNPRSFSIKVFAFLAIISALSPTSSAQQPSDAENVLNVVTYNVQFLPGWAAAANERKEPIYRANTIGEKMAKFDIVALNEVFDDSARERILDKLRAAWGEDMNVIVSPKPEDRFNGGCLIASPLPFLETHAMIFEHFSTPEEYGLRADGHAAKGVIHARIARTKDDRDNYVDVFATHLEARADHLRPKQYEEMAAFIAQHADAEHPALIIGDMNTKGTSDFRADPESQYNQLMTHLKEALPESTVIDMWPELKGDAFGGTSEQHSIEEGKRIDYIFVANPKPRTMQLEPVDIRVNLHQDERVVALSDHNAVEGDFLWPTRTDTELSKD